MVWQGGDEEEEEAAWPGLVWQGKALRL
jgi:hypothetical protein